jgi:hypothetical protein
MAAKRLVFLSGYQIVLLTLFCHLAMLISYILNPDRRRYSL